MKGEHEIFVFMSTVIVLIIALRTGNISKAVMSILFCLLLFALVYGAVILINM